MIVDSGAGVNVLPSSLLDESRRAQIDTSRRMTLCGFDGSEQRTEGVLYTKVKVGDCRTWMSFCVVKDARATILGMPGLRTMGLQVDFARGEVRRDGASAPLPLVSSN